jgi:hypothetical protein
MCASQGTAQVNVQREVTASPTPQALPHCDPRILANTRGEYPVSDSPRRVTALGYTIARLADTRV